MIDVEVEGVDGDFELDEGEVFRLLQLDSLPEKVESLENEVFTLRNEVEVLKKQILVLSKALCNFAVCAKRSSG